MTSGSRATDYTDPTCYQAKMDTHVAQAIAAKPELAQISTAYGVQQEGSPVLPRNKYTAIRDERPMSKDEAKRPEYKECKYTAETIITEGSDVGILLATSRHNGTHVLKDAAALYKVDPEAIGQKVKQEFAAKAKVKNEPEPEAKAAPKAKKAA